MRLLSFEDPLDPQTSFLVYYGPGFALWYRVTLAAGQAVDWQRI